MRIVGRSHTLTARNASKPCDLTARERDMLAIKWSLGRTTRNYNTICWSHHTLRFSTGTYDTLEPHCGGVIESFPPSWRTKTDHYVDPSCLCSLCGGGPLYVGAKSLSPLTWVNNRRKKNSSSFPLQRKALNRTINGTGPKLRFAVGRPPMRCSFWWDDLILTTDDGNLKACTQISPQF